MKKTVDFKMGDGTYRLTSMDAKTLQEFLDWAKATMPDPVDEVVETAEKLPESYRDKWFEKHLDGAVERKRLRGTLNDPDLDAFSRTAHAATRVVFLMLRPEHPTLTEADVADLMLQVDPKELERVQGELDRAAKFVPVSEEAAERRFFRSAGKGSKAKRR